MIALVDRLLHGRAVQNDERELGRHEEGRSGGQHDRGEQQEPRHHSAGHGSRSIVIDWVSITDRHDRCRPGGMDERER